MDFPASFLIWQTPFSGASIKGWEGVVCYNNRVLRQQVQNRCADSQPWPAPKDQTDKDSFCLHMMMF